MKHFKDNERERQQKLIETKFFNGTVGGGYFRGKNRAFVLANGDANLYAPIKDEVIAYFKDNHINWWGGSKPTGNILSSQIACLNHLFGIRNDASTVLALLRNIRDEFTEVYPICSDENPAYIAFEVVSTTDHLNEGSSTRGSNCTSIDALIYAKHKSGKLWLIPIEWKYTEHYNNQDKSKEDRKNEPKGSNGQGTKRMNRYNKLITSSSQLKTLANYTGSLYYFEPFYQLMRQTLWVENMVRYKEVEQLKADNFLHVHIIPPENDELLQKKYKVSGDKMENSWRSLLNDQSKYQIVAPQEFLSPTKQKYPELYNYLLTRYWKH